MNNYNNEKYFMMRIRGDFHYKTLNDLFKSFNLAKNKINYLIQNNCCYLNGDIATLDTIIKQNDYLMIDISNFEQLDYIPEDKKLEILYEDDYLLIINKPSGYIIYPDDKNKTSTVANFVANYYQKNNIDATIRHCHRLDIQTTGCLVYAKDLITQSAMQKMFENHNIEKNYLAIVEGMFFGKGKISTPIGKDRHTNGKMVTHNNGQPALTFYEVLDSNKRTSLLKVNIKTGRTHQIRVHLSSILHPIYGDKLYGSINESDIMLHCYTLEFNHPILGKKINVKAPISFNFNKLLKEENLKINK